MEKLESIKIIEKNPAILKDINLFRLTFFPSQLFVFKYFLDANRPLTIRECYRASGGNINGKIKTPKTKV
jgi:hypothetical protein